MNPILFKHSFFSWLIFSGLLMVIPFQIKAQQAIQFSQYVFNGLVLNPAYSGYRENTNAHLIYRTQWTGLEGAPKTTSFSIDGVSKNLKHGIGFQVVDDQLGAQSNLLAELTYAYRIELGESARLSFGLAGGISQFRLDGSLLSTFDPSENLMSQSRSIINPDLKFGLFFATDQYFLGLSVTDLLTNSLVNNPSFYVIKPTKHYYLTFGALYDLDDHLAIKPSLLVKDDFKGPMNVDFNLFFLFAEKIWVGGSYRTGFNVFNPNKSIETNLSNSDALSLMAEYYINPTLRLGYAYDYTTSPLKSISGGTHELSLGLQLDHWYHHRLQNPRLF